MRKILTKRCLGFYFWFSSCDFLVQKLAWFSPPQKTAEVEPMQGSTGGGTEIHVAGAGFAYVTQAW